MNAAHRFSNDLRYRDENDPKQTALTPEYILAPVRFACGGAIALDPCTTAENPVGALRYYSPPQDGAALPWDAAVIFVNPPYGKARERWVERCIQAYRAGSKVVLLMPSHTDTRCFQSATCEATCVVFVRGRVKYDVLRPNRRRAAASHPSALIGYGVDLGLTGLGLTVYPNPPGGSA